MVGHGEVASRLRRCVVDYRVKLGVVVAEIFQLCEGASQEHVVAHKRALGASGAGVLA